jgi:thiol-disulfide isomerase/thioredoxin
MAATPSTMQPLGTQAPDFSLLDTVSGKMISLQQLRSDIATVIMFICNHCPYVKHVQPELIRLGRDYGKQGVSFVAISSNDAIGYPDDGPERMKTVAIEQGYPFPYLYDETQQVARAYAAACTPDFYVFDQQLRLAYRGQLDASRPGSGRLSNGSDLRAALDALLAGSPVDPRQTPSIGCNIKWVKTRA